eukprot:5885128-Prymnesium_polylepis.1
MRQAMRPAPSPRQPLPPDPTPPATAPWPAVACRAQQVAPLQRSRAGDRAPRGRCTMMRPAKGRARGP